MNLPNGMGRGLRVLRGSVALGLVWTPLWITLFYALLGLILILFRPGPDSDIGTLRMTLIMGWVGFCSGVLFGVFVALVERGRAIGNIPWHRAALWGFLAAAAYPLLTGRADQVVWTCPFGALIAIGLRALPGGGSWFTGTSPRRLRDRGEAA